MEHPKFSDYLENVLSEDPEMRVLCEQELLNHVIGNEVRKIRLERGWSQKELAVKMNTTQSVIARIEWGKSNISLKTLGRLTASLGATVHLAI